MNSNWPEGVEPFEDFLRSRGMACQRRGEVPRYGEKLMLYADKALAVRLLSEKGDWFLEIADNEGRPSEWYDPELLGNLAGDPRSNVSADEVLSIQDQFRVVEDNWSAIRDLFSPERGEGTHRLLDIMRKERAKRMFPGWKPKPGT